MNQALLLFRRKPWTALTAGVALAIVALPLANSVRTGGSPVSGVERIGNVLEMLSGRSPGERGDATLDKIKASSLLDVKAEEPEASDRALGKIFPPDAIEQIAPGLGPPPSMLDQVGPPPLLDDTSYLPSPLALPLPIAFVPGGGGFGGGGFGGGPGGGGISAPGPVSPPGVSAIPEPQTWLMLLIGFCLSGVALRRRGRTRPLDREEGCTLAR